jgi:hypothetical protein
VGFDDRCEKKKHLNNAILVNNNSPHTTNDLEFQSDCNVDILQASFHHILTAEIWSMAAGLPGRMSW